MFKCVEKCPLTHYADPLTKTCMPCDENCFGCTGPKNIIGQSGCTRCSSAIVDNDHAYTVVSCIQKDEYNCTDDHFLDIVPSYLTMHPLKGQTVCRKCNKECDGCFRNGAQLKTQCEKCTNFYSKSTNECVNDCAYHNEYLESETQVKYSNILRIGSLI